MVSYVDSEVKIFHPLCEASLNQALKNLGLDSDYEVLHHQYTGTLEMDYVVRNSHTKKYLCVIEVKRTPADVQSTRYQVQALILSILVYTFFSRMFDLMLPPVAKHSIAVA